MNTTSISSLLDDIGCKYCLNAPMSEYTTFKIGGPADVLAVPETVDELQKLIRAAYSNGIDYFILGKGSNLLVHDCGIRGLVIFTGSLNSICLADDNTIMCHCGALLSRLCAFALENELSGLEFAYGIPGSAGGAAYMNAGAYGGEMKDVLSACTAITEQGDLVTFAADDMQLGYRTSAFATNHCTVIQLELKLKKGNAQDIKSKMTDFITRRKDKQPLDYPSAGSTFKRPQGNYAGALIEQCGLKGFSVGGAAVSEKHAGFVINKGSASCDDVLKLIAQVQLTVFQNTGYKLETEIKII